MVNKMRNLILLAAASLILSGLAIAREFYQFPQVPNVQDRDIFLVRRPKTTGFDNNTGSRNVTGQAIRQQFTSGVLRYRGKYDALANYTTCDFVTYSSATGKADYVYKKDHCIAQ